MLVGKYCSSYNVDCKEHILKKIFEVYHEVKVTNFKQAQSAN